MLKSKLCGPGRWGWYFRVGFPLHVCGCVVFLHRLLNFTKRRRLQDFLPCERRLSILWLLTQKNGMLKKPFLMVREGSRISKDLLKVVWEKPKPENDDGDDISSRHRDM